MRRFAMACAVLVGPTLAVLTLLAVPVWWQPTIPFDWCGSSENWLICYRAWLGSLSGWVAAAGAISGALLLYRASRQQIRQAWAQTELRRRQELRAAQLEITSQLDAMSNSYRYAIEDTNNYFKSNGAIGKGHIKLPIQQLAPSNLALLDPEKSEGLFNLIRDIEAQNDASTFFLQVAEADDIAREVLDFAAYAAIEALYWRNIFALEIEWDYRIIDHKELKMLVKRAKKYCKKHRDEYPPHLDLEFG